MMNSEFFICRSEYQKECAAESILNRPIDKAFCVKIEDKEPKRTDLQNRYLWGWLYDQIAKNLEEAGIVICCEDDTEQPWTKEVLHEFFKIKFLMISEIVSKKGKTLPLTKSTTKLTSKEFNQYVEDIEKFCYMFWSISIPKPNRGKWYDYYRELGL